MISRKVFLIAVLLGALHPSNAWSPTTARMPIVGVLGTTRTPTTDSLVDGLRDLGWTEGKNLTIEWRWAGGHPELHLEHAAEFLKLGVDVIYAPDSAQVQAALAVTRTIPIVFAIHADPLGVGHVASLARPGGNVTGLALLLTEMSAKELEILREIFPQARKVGVLWNPAFPSHGPALRALEAVAADLGLTLQPAAAKAVEDYEGAFADLARHSVDAVVMVASTIFIKESRRLADLGIKYRLPTIFAFREFARNGGLISYGPNVGEALRRSAGYVDRILKGTNPADMPVEQPTRFELVVNARTATALGLTLPAAVLARADEVIE